MQIVLLDVPECHAYLNVFGSRAYVHLDVRKWSKTVLRRMLALWPTILTYIRAHGVRELCTYPEQNDKRFEKFAHRFGFQFMKAANGYMVYAHEGNPHG